MSVFFRFLTTAALIVCSPLAESANGEAVQSGELLEEVHFLIPAGPGGGGMAQQEVLARRLENPGW